MTLAFLFWARARAKYFRSGRPLLAVSVADMAHLVWKLPQISRRLRLELLFGGRLTAHALLAGCWAEITRDPSL